MCINRAFKTLCEKGSCSNAPYDKYCYLKITVYKPTLLGPLNKGKNLNIGIIWPLLSHSFHLCHQCPHLPFSHKLTCRISALTWPFKLYIHTKNLKLCWDPTSMSKMFTQWNVSIHWERLDWSCGSSTEVFALCECWHEFWDGEYWSEITSVALSN